MSAVAGLCGGYMFRFLRKSQTIFQVRCALYSPTHNIRVIWFPAASPAFGAIFFILHILSCLTGYGSIQMIYFILDELGYLCCQGIGSFHLVVKFICVELFVVLLSSSLISAPIFVISYLSV